MMVIETDRLHLRQFSTDDAGFILRLVNEPSFIENINDKGVRTLDDARAYLQNGPLASYEKNGFGVWCVLLKETGQPIGMCGLIKRDALDDIDVGYALLPEFCSMGYAIESAAAVVSYAKTALGLERIVAIVNPENKRSIRLLEKLGFRYERMVRLSEDDREIKLFATGLMDSNRS